MNDVLYELRELQAWLIYRDQPEFCDAVKAAIAALSAPPEPKAEPVAWKCDALISMDPDDVEYWTTKGFPVTPLFAHPSAPPEGWQPIGTAPKDGTSILLYFPHCNLVIRGSYEWQGESDWELGIKDWMDWTTDDEVVLQEDPSYAPTHWMPLPAPPAPETQE